MDLAHAHGASGDSLPGPPVHDGQIAEALCAQICRSKKDLRGKEERMQMMEKDFEQTQGQEARELGRAVGGREQAKSPLPFDLNSHSSHWLSRVLSSEREGEHGRQKLMSRAGHKHVEGNAGKTEGEREGGREGDSLSRNSC